MRPIPQKHRKLIDSDPYYRTCARIHEGGCEGRITIEHVFIYAGKQISEMWNYIPLCVRHHLGAGFDKKVNEWISLSRATPADLARYPNFKWGIRKSYLDGLYGVDKGVGNRGKTAAAA